MVKCSLTYSSGRLVLTNCWRRKAETASLNLCLFHTKKIYTHVTNKMKEDASQKVQQTFGSILDLGIS
ncbi:hypothetical protein C3733_09740 [Bacillus amyloliquefaciens]|nr:hypothetical protein C3733_09740 [Bacillus amyloliquefaciens]